MSKTLYNIVRDSLESSITRQILMLSDPFYSMPYDNPFPSTYLNGTLHGGSAPGIIYYA